MEDLFRHFWWLLFPLGWMIVGGFNSWLAYRARRDTLDLIKGYAKSGREIPAGLVDKLGRGARTGG